MAAVAMALKRHADGVLSPQGSPPLAAGLAESAVPTVLGFALLSVAWLLAAVGFRRQI